MFSNNSLPWQKEIGVPKLLRLECCSPSLLLSTPSCEGNCKWAGTKYRSHKNSFPEDPPKIVGNDQVVEMQSEKHIPEVFNSKVAIVFYLSGEKKVAFFLIIIIIHNNTWNSYYTFLLKSLKHFTYIISFIFYNIPEGICIINILLPWDCVFVNSSSWEWMKWHPNRSGCWLKVPCNLLPIPS